MAIELDCSRNLLISIIEHRLHLFSPWDNGVTVDAELVSVRKEALSGA